MNFLKKILSGIPSECQTVLTLIRPDNSSGLIWVKTVCQGYQQMTLVDKELKRQTQQKLNLQTLTVDPDEGSHLDLQCLPSSL